MGYDPEQSLYEVLFATPATDVRLAGSHRRGTPNDIAEDFGFFVHKALWQEYRQFGLGNGHDLADFDTYHRVRGLRWPVVNGRETQWRYREGYDPYVKPGEGFNFYGKALKKIPSGGADGRDGRSRRQGQDLLPALRDRRRRARTASTTCGSAPVACSSTGTPAR